MIRISYVVCDDDAIISEAIDNRVYQILTDCGMEVHHERTTSPVALYNKIVTQGAHYDLLFLDIDMPRLDGVKLAKLVRKKEGEKTEIVFVSNREDRVFDTFGVHPFGFVRKNNFGRDLHDTLRSYMDLRVQSESYLAVKTNNNSVTRQLRVGEIVYIESFRSSQTIYMEDGEEVSIRMTMEELEKSLREYNIIRVHKGYLVNLKYVRKIERAGVLVDYKGGTMLSVSREKLQSLKAVYLEYLRNTGAVAFGAR